MSLFLTGRETPRDIRDQPSELINTPIGQMMRPMIEQMFGPSSIPAGAPLVFDQAGLNPQLFHPSSFQGAPAPPSKPTPKFVGAKTPSIYPAGQVVTIFAKLKAFLEEEKPELRSDPASLDLLDRALKSAFNTKTLKLTEGVFQFLEELLDKFPADKGFPLLDILRLIFSLDPPSVLRLTAATAPLPLEKILRKYGTDFDFQKSKPTAVMATRVVSLHPIC